MRRESGKVAIEGDLQRLKGSRLKRDDEEEEAVTRRIKEAYEGGCVSVAREEEGSMKDGWWDATSRMLLVQHFTYLEVW